MYDIFDMVLESAQFRDGLEGQRPSQGRRAWQRRVSQPGRGQRQNTAGLGQHTRPVVTSSLSDLDMARILVLVVSLEQIGVYTVLHRCQCHLFNPLIVEHVIYVSHSAVMNHIT